MEGVQSFLEGKAAVSGTDSCCFADSLTSSDAQSTSAHTQPVYLKEQNLPLWFSSGAFLKAVLPLQVYKAI